MILYSISSVTNKHTNKDLISTLSFFQVLVECDPVMKQFLLHLDEKLKLGTKFVIQDLDENRLFISAEVLEQLQQTIDDLMDKASVPLTND